MYIYYPSCNFKRQFPETAARIKEYMETQADVRVAGCCHKTSDLPSEGDTIVTVCLSCMRILDEVREDIPGISLFEFLLTRSDFRWPDCAGAEFVLQDCFRARGKHALQDAVRSCLEKMRAGVIEMPGNRDEELFDGAFLMHAPYPGNQEEAPLYFRDYLPAYVNPVPEEDRPALFRAQTEKYGGRRAVGYCNACVRAVKSESADISHLAELIFPEN